MISRYRIYKIELSLIYMLSCLLVVSLMGLGAYTVHANQSADGLYSGLTCDFTPDIVIPEQKTVYFTFDDGPSKNTEKILDILLEENVKATFFVCAQKSDSADAPKLMRRMLDEGHEIGLHSYTHDYNIIYSSLDSYLKDLSELNDYIIEVTGYRPSIVRLPGGTGTMHASPALIKEITNELAVRGYRIYDWDVESGDQTTTINSSEFIANKIAKGTKNRHRVIVLMHDSPRPKTSPQATKLAITMLKEQGYTFDKLTACIDPEKHFS